MTQGHLRQVMKVCMQTSDASNSMSLYGKVCVLSACSYGRKEQILAVGSLNDILWNCFPLMVTVELYIYHMCSL